MGEQAPDEGRPDPRVPDAAAGLLEACGGPGVEYAEALAIAAMVTVYTLLVEKGIATPEEVKTTWCSALRKLGIEINERRALEAMLGSMSDE